VTESDTNARVASLASPSAPGASSTICKMNLKDVAAVTHLFISGAQVKDVTNVCGVSVNSAKKWYTLLRGLIKRFMEATQRPTGGHHLTVEADEV